MEIGLDQHQRQKLTMTPELNQAIALLQYPAIELASYIDGKALENPLIEIAEEYPQTAGRNQNNSLWIDQITDETVSLKSYLQGQIPFKVLTDIEERVLLFLIDNMDEDGYLCIAFEEARSFMEIRKAEWEVALSVLQAMEPAGVGAHSLKECLLLQAKREQIKNPFLEKVLDDYFELLVNRKWKELAKLVGVTVMDIQLVFDQIQKYTPKPCSFLHRGRPQYAIPDVSVTFSEGVPVIKVLSMRTVKTNEFTSSFDTGNDELTKRYMDQKRAELNWLKKSLIQREETICRVTHAIVERQPTFFKTGKSETVKPLTMKQIAEMIHVHESTVSRAIRDKIVETPFGSFEMKLFFTSSISTNQMEDSSSEQVKQQIVQLIKAEQKTSPLSDESIAKQLKQFLGILISRRTIAKYRNQLHIPASSMRKRYELSE